MHPTRRARFLGLVLVAAALCSCADDPLQQHCTLIGCDDGFTVSLSGNIPSELVLTISGPSFEAQSFEVDCSSYRCGQLPVASLSGSTPAEITITVSSGGSVIEQTVQPQYENVQPNGPNCPPVCARAAVEIVL